MFAQTVICIFWGKKQIQAKKQNKTEKIIPCH